MQNPICKKALKLSKRSQKERILDLHALLFKVVKQIRTTHAGNMTISVKFTALKGDTATVPMMKKNIFGKSVWKNNEN